MNSHPLTSPMVMPAPIAVGEATVVLLLRVGARVYARAIVRTGRRLKVHEVLA